MQDPTPHLERRLGIWHATAINMSNMVGSGIFIALPLIFGLMSGPGVLLAWLLGAAIAVADALVWSELCMTFPGTGGSYLYLLNAFGREKWGLLMAFLFVFQIVTSGPLEIASANIGIGQYVGYLWRGLSPFGTKLIAATMGVLATLLLYRKIHSIARLMLTLWIGVLGTTLWIIASGVAHFNGHMAFVTFGQGQVVPRATFAGLGPATVYVMYCFLGYYAICYLGDEVTEPVRNLPRSMLISVLAIAAIYCLISLSVVGVMSWKDASASQFIASEFMQKLYGHWAGTVMTFLVIWTAFASSCALMLAYSRIPYAAAQDGNFFSVFSTLHPEKDFPHYSLLLIGGLTVIASFFSLDQVIQSLMTARILVQFIGQIVALAVLHRSHSSHRRRYYLYPLPAIIAFIGWVYVFLSAGVQYISYGLFTLTLGAIGFFLMARKRRVWPFSRPLTVGVREIQTPVRTTDRNSEN